MAKVVYTAKANVTGGRANGHGVTDDGALDIQLRPPTEGGGTNPEQLFAIGYAACFEGAIGAVGRRERLEVGDVSIASSVSLVTAEDRSFTYVPSQSEWRLSDNAAYLHYTANETIGGVEFGGIPDVSDVPVVSDMSSNLLSRPLDLSRLGLIYAGAQKNIGPAGLALVIIREDLIGIGEPAPPAMLDYATHAKARSMYNTPPTFAVYIAGLVFQWLLENGGLAAAEERNIAKAKLLYDFIDSSDFYVNPVDKADRSRMNIPFRLADPALEADFLAGAATNNMVELKGHRSVGGMRASLYNAMPIEGVQTLVDYMAEFAATKG